MNTVSTGADAAVGRNLFVSPLRVPAHDSVDFQAPKPLDNDDLGGSPETNFAVPGEPSPRAATPSPTDKADSSSHGDDTVGSVTRKISLLQMNSAERPNAPIDLTNGDDAPINKRLRLDGPEEFPPLPNGERKPFNARVAADKNVAPRSPCVSPKFGLVRKMPDKCTTTPNTTTSKMRALPPRPNGKVWRNSFHSEFDYLQAKDSDLVPLSQDNQSELVQGMSRHGVRLLCVDFDLTFVRMDTSRWEYEDSENIFKLLKGNVRPAMQSLMESWLKLPGTTAAIVSFNRNQDVLERVVLSVFPEEYHSRLMVVTNHDSCMQYVRDNATCFQQFLREQTQLPSRHITHNGTFGKLPHMWRAMISFRERESSGQTQCSAMDLCHCVLIDDDFSNVRVCLEYTAAPAFHLHAIQKGLLFQKMRDKFVPDFRIAAAGIDGSPLRADRNGERNHATAAAEADHADDFIKRRPRFGRSMTCPM